MTKYDNLDASKEIEQVITQDLKRALEKRGFTIVHNSNTQSHSPAGKSDIELYNNGVHINVEITKSYKSSQDREWQSIKDHFEETIKNHSNKNCFLIFVSPETYYRTINSIKDWNFAHIKDKDKKIMPVCFSTFELLINKLIESTKEKYPLKELLNLFNNFVKFIDDESILREFYENLFSTDLQLKNEIEKREEERHQKVVEELISGFKQLEQKLRDEGIATGERAIRNVIYLVFIKLYEEKKEKEESQRNRFTISTFREYQVNMRDKKKSIHKLFNDIKNDAELKSCKLFSNEDVLATRLEDDFVIAQFIESFEPYAFYTTKVDGLGAAYEVLGQLSGKDTKLGQFFTPENVVKFMVKLAELDTEDIVFDPACGTARFLTHSMEDMVNKTMGMRDQKNKIENFKKKQLLGTDFDPTVAKLAKMNMYIHGDGKTNILDEDGLTQIDKDKKIDVILTNPPLGDLDYYSSRYDDDFRKKRMEVIPKKNLTKEKLEKAIENIKINTEKLTKQINVNKIKKIKERLNELKKTQSELEYKINHNESDYIVSSKLMKGGGLFLNACKHYLKDCRNNSEKIEWQGGKVLIVLDEGILNTDNYKEVREFIKKNFYIKAIISLTKDAFVPVSKTMTKTSILYAIKKADLDSLQVEPIFFAHVDKVGLNTKKKVCENHLFDSGKDILSKFFEFKKAIVTSYEGLNFNRKKFESYFKAGEING